VEFAVKGQSWFSMLFAAIIIVNIGLETTLEVNGTYAIKHTLHAKGKAIYKNTGNNGQRTIHKKRGNSQKQGWSKDHT
jgi:hypothetical protein